MRLGKACQAEKRDVMHTEALKWNCQTIRVTCFFQTKMNFLNGHFTDSRITFAQPKIELF